MKVKWLLFLLVCSHPFFIRAVIVSGSRWKINGKTLILLGDYHVRTLHDKEQIRLIEGLLKKQETQLLFEGLSVGKRRFFDIHTQGNSPLKLDHLLSSLAFSYYDELFAPSQENQSRTLFKISNYSQKIQNSDKFLSTFADDFKKLSDVWHLNSLLDFFVKKDSFNIIGHHGIDMRLSVSLLKAEFNKKNLSETDLSETDLRFYLEQFFNEKKKVYQDLLEKLQKLKNEIPQVYKKYEKIYKIIKLNHLDFLNFENNTPINFSHYEKVLHTLINFDFLCSLLNALFFGKRTTVVGIFGAEHADWIERILVSMHLKSELLYKAVDTQKYQVPLDEQIRNDLKTNNLNRESAVKFIQDTKEKLKTDPEHRYYYKDTELERVPLKSDRIEELLGGPKKKIFKKKSDFFDAKVVHAKKVAQLQKLSNKDNRKKILKALKIKENK